MKKYKVTFKDDKLGREGQGPMEPFEVHARDIGHLEDQVLIASAPRLVSSSVEVEIDDDLHGVVVVGGWRVVGQFTAEDAGV